MTMPKWPQAAGSWAPLPWPEWKETCDTLHMWMQIVGKVKLELHPFLNQFWEVAFHITARGMTTGIIPSRGSAFDVEFDFIDHTISIRTSEGLRRVRPLEPRSVAEFYDMFMAELRAAGIGVTIDTMPVEVPAPVPFEKNRTDAAYDADAVHRWWHIQMQIDTVLQVYRSGFIGKSSPTQFFWGSFDLSETRFSGRPAPMPQGPLYYRLAENQENFACGFWPGNPNAAGIVLGEPALYAYIYPEPAEFKAASVLPDAAYYHKELGEFILPYDAVRTSPAPEQAILDFCQSCYDAAATLAHWDRKTLEHPPPWSRPSGDHGSGKT